MKILSAGTKAVDRLSMLNRIPYKHLVNIILFSVTYLFYMFKEVKEKRLISEDKDLIDLGWSGFGRESLSLQSWRNKKHKYITSAHLDVARVLLLW